ncbi:phospholipase/carboxylesterase [Bacillus mesophilus]|uniref:Alpha/beta hydrolase n=1 Tax=Bacillus mesophilus TaxID=1808955 RepID=A0A6M0Q8K6_9BACI|nr:alpha/beta hydrolase [Bacillus mesophilus]MBM7661935.1 phospholipase/carboxylesterase [Bacillus mesophilus]NEY72706.1 alpha/beta hydrolase [Bacillus mesophilus]
MEHIFKQGPSDQTLLLLHGTGGNERDLLPLAEMIAPNASILGVRGNILENGMPRFFRRLSEGVFDEEDLIFRTNELHQTINDLSERYKFKRDQVIAVGYSNGANIAASLLYHYKDSLKGAILFHAMVPLRGFTLPDLSEAPVYIGAGKRDPLIPAAETKELADELRKANAEVTEHWGEGGHELTRAEVEQAGIWYGEHFTS